LKISDLTKVYDNGFKAVNGVNLKMYSGQIFALLGHNGAGKSTTISMLTGLLSKSTGEAQVYQNDLFREMQQVRRYLGVCPQHDVLFDNLTPEEHLDIFYDFKGGDPRRKRAEITDLIRDVSLGPDKRKMAVSLSGGNRRKLSVSIALCGGSKLVLFDEPTAGMDLGARRSLWDMLKNYKRDKIIILTTHYMDEADVLGDRIGIMAEGKILCLGTSLFLKDRYGSGYKLTIVKKSKK
jgi:ATP-binding cassette subfamily A (ABC1) protein 3